MAPPTSRRASNRYNQSVVTFRQIATVLTGVLLGLSGSAFGQGQGMEGLAQTFGADLDPEGAYPRYRIEVLAFAYNGFDSDEEVFPDEPFEMRLDTRPPMELIAPSPRSPELLASLVLPQVGGEDVAGIDTTVGRDIGPTPNHEPLGPADDAAIRSLVGGFPSAGEPGLPTAEPGRVRSAYAQKLIASLQTVDDPSKVPILYGAFPEDPEPSGTDAIDSGPLEGGAPVPGAEVTDATVPGPLAEVEAEPASAAPPSAFRILRADELELHPAALRLQRDADYTPLAHGGWIQPAFPPELAIPINLSLLGTVNPAGTVQLHLSRFLHVTVDLVYRSPPIPPHLQVAMNADSGLTELTLPRRYALRTQRRVRSGDVHYLDHPAIGLLVLVTPAPVETPDTDDTLDPAQGPAA